MRNVAGIVSLIVLGAGSVRGSDAQTTSLVAIVPNADAPAELIDADVVPTAFGAPEMIAVKIRNFSEESVLAVGLEVFVFDSDNMLRRELRFPTRPVGATAAYSLEHAALLVGATAAVDLPVQDAEATSQSNVAVAVTEVKLASRDWVANPRDVRREAVEVVLQLNHRF
jgi:hypothetical protein